MKKQLILATALSTLSLTAFASYTQLSLGLGLNAMYLSKFRPTASGAEFTGVSGGNTQTKFTPSLSDTFHLTFAKNWDWQIGGQYLFAPRTSTGVAYTTDGVTNNDTFKVQSHILLLNSGFGYHTSRFELSGFGGLGTSYNQQKGDVSATNGITGTFGKRNTWVFAWDIGAAADYQLSAQWALGLQYQFIHANKSRTGIDSILGTNTLEAATNRHVVLATISYLFNRTGTSI